MLWEGDKLMYRGVSYDAAYLGDTLLWRNFINDYFTIEVVSGGTINFNFSQKNTEMSINGGQFTTIGVMTYTATAGDIIRLRGSESIYASSTAHIRGYDTVKYKVYGNIMSLIHGDDFPDKKTTCGFSNFFKDCTSIIDASGLILPATQVSQNGYNSMFYGCTSLLEAPELPATSLGQQCYGTMFAGCSSLMKAPSILPASELYLYCYLNMFSNCTSLTTSPILPAERLNTLCYNRMFYNCTSLNKVTCLATDISAQNCTADWLYGVSQTGTFYKDANTTWPSGSSGIPNGWTVIDA